MDIEHNSTHTQVELVRENATIGSDGLLLYVAQATYEPGTSPLSLWVPAKAYAEERTADASADTSMDVGTREAPLDIFERFVLL